MRKKMKTASSLFVEKKENFGETDFFIVRARPDENGYPVATTKLKERYRFLTIQEMEDLYHELGVTLQTLRDEYQELPDAVYGSDYLEAVRINHAMTETADDDVTPPKVR